MTSAIDGLSVAHVRKGLGEMRSRYEMHSPQQPLCLTEKLFCDKTVQAFAREYCLGHHEKRHNKSKNNGQRKKRTETVSAQKTAGTLAGLLKRKIDAISPAEEQASPSPPSSPLLF